MPAWQKRQPSVQPRAISTETRSKMVSVEATGPSCGNGCALRSSTIARSMGKGSPGSIGPLTTRMPVSGSTSVS